MPATSTNPTSTSNLTSTSPTSTSDVSPARYLAPDAASRRILNPLRTRLVKLGVGLRGGRILHVRGRRSGA